jgi:hypothetical protein
MDTTQHIKLNRQFKLGVIGTASPDVVVRVRGRVVPIRGTRTRVRPIVPIATKKRGT